ncbi:ECF transporter S component [Ruminococcaceae bacterium OttesenSCG-928-A16]|nr:ECF transporter S component [Ruminococcaceae bacterium OttesenSCG-928-A16]
MQKSKHTLSVSTLAVVGILSALVFVTSFLSIPIGDISRIHFGNIMCLLSGLLFGPLIGGISAGLGSMLFDVFNPLYAPEFWITFLTKFAMGFVAGWLHRYGFKKLHAKLRYLFSALIAALVYVVLYLFKNFILSYYVKGIPWNALWVDLSIKAGSSTVNAIIAVIGSVLLALALQPALAASGLFKKQLGQ